VAEKEGDSQAAGEDYGRLLILGNGTAMILNISDYLIGRNECPLFERLQYDCKDH
jgi:hypothetical protein